MMQSLFKEKLWLLVQLNIHFPNGPVILFLGINQKGIQLMSMQKFASECS